MIKILRVDSFFYSEKSGTDDPALGYLHKNPPTLISEAHKRSSSNNPFYYTEQLEISILLVHSLNA